MKNNQLMAPSVQLFQFGIKFIKIDIFEMESLSGCSEAQAALRAEWVDWLID